MVQNFVKKKLLLWQKELFQLFSVWGCDIIIKHKTHKNIKPAGEK